jgi:hypothetical protein
MALALLKHEDDALVVATQNKQALLNAAYMPGKLLPTGWLCDNPIDAEEFAQHLQALLSIEKGSMWWLGDLLNRFEGQHGQKYAAALPTAKRDYMRCANAKWVASAYQFSLRNENLTWSHHRILAPLDEDMRALWMQRCEAEGWSVNQLRQQLQDNGITKTLKAEAPPLRALEGETVPTETEPPRCLTEFFREPKTALEAETEPTPATDFDLSSASYPSRRTDREALEAIQRASSAFLIDGTLMPPVLIDGYLYVASLGIEANERTGESKILAFEVMERVWWDKQMVLSRGIGLEEWKRQVSAGERKAHEIKSLCLPTKHTQPPMEYVFTGERVLFWCLKEAEEPGKPAEKRSDPVQVGASSAQVGATNGAIHATNDATAKDWRSVVIGALMEAKAALERAYEATPTVERQTLPVANYVGAAGNVAGWVGEWMKALQADEDEVEPDEEDEEPVTLEDWNEEPKRLPLEEQLFHGGFYGTTAMRCLDQADRILRVDRCEDVAVLKDALHNNLQKAVRQRLEAKIRRLEKG